MELSILYLFTGLIIGGVIIWFLRGRTLIADKSRLEERARNSESAAAELKAELVTERDRCSGLQQDLTKSQADVSNLHEKLETQKGEIEEIQKKFNIQFENLANKIFEEKSSKFTEQNKSNILEVLKPLNEKIMDFQKRVEETYDKESKQRFSLEKELKRLFELNEQITLEANNLTSALKGESKTQGNWGEMILETLLEKSGLIKNTHFQVQQSVRSEDGRRLQPDVVINLPEDKNMIIDSKVSLTAYERYYSTEDEAEKESALKQHIVSLKKHIDELSSKKYQDLYEINNPDFVLMFVPIEPAFGLAVLHEPGLFNYAVEKNVAIISPTTLLATLRMIATIWRQEYQNKNVLEIARQSGGLYDKFVGFVEDLQDIEKNIKGTAKSYESAFNKLSSGKGNIITRIEKLKKLGAKTSKKLSREIVDNSDADSNELEE
jgi:DNA recombination protein RmuC